MYIMIQIVLLLWDQRMHGIVEVYIICIHIFQCHYLLENKFEKYQITSSGQMPTNVVNNQTIGYVEYYGINMDRSIYARLIDEQNGRNGLFYASCFSHTNGIMLAAKGTRIKGYNGTELVGDWFWEKK
eukprot:518213_1